MDSNLRTLLSVSQQYGPVKGNSSLQEAYDILRNVAEVRPAVDAPDSFGQDLYVLCAETAFQHGHSDMAKECLKMYFMRTPPANQFLCRAYLCQAQLLAPSSADNPEQLDKAVVYLLKAINMAKEHQRYHFLVYNASVIYWQFSRPFLKPSYKQFLAQSLHQVVKALDDIDDKDYEWRAQLMIALIECHMDAGHKNDASHIATASAAFVRQHVPSLYKTLFGLMTRHQLIDSSNAKIQSEMKSSSELSAYHKLCKLKLSVEQKDPEKNVAEEIRKILAQVTDKQWKSNKNDASVVSQEKERMGLLLELGRLASEQDLPDIGIQCAEYIKERLHLTKDQGFFLEVEFLQCELMVRSLQDKQHSYHKTYVDIRLQSIKRCNEAILSAVRNAHPNVIQAGCTTQWNLCMPLLQPNLRRHVRKPLTLVAEALEDIQSLLIRLRCQVHTELAKCEEDGEQIEVAMQHLKKALALDDGSVYQERLQLALHRLELRAELYKQPETLEDQAAMIIEQARKANSGTMRMKRSLLVKAGQALAPDAFLLVLESESDSKEASAGRGPLTQIKRKAGKAQQFKNCVKKAEGHLRRLGDENDRERAQLWGDLAKTARKQEVWDVCRVAARFCLLYDDGRWKIEQPAKEPAKPQRTKSVEREATLTDGPEAEKSTTDLNKSSSRISRDPGSRPATPEKPIPLFDKDLVRMMAEVRFVNGEALIHLLRTEGLELGDKPIPPTDKSKRPKGYKAKKPEDDPDWLEYTDWTKSLTTAAIDSFLRAIALGIQLKEPWIVCSSSSYVWNYINHILKQNRHSEFTGTLESLLDGIRQVGHAGETILLVDICNALAVSLIQPWFPSPQPESNAVTAPSPRGDKSPTRNKSPKRGGAKSQAAVKAKPSGPSVTISPDATPDLKKAIEVCDYAMRITNGDRPANIVPIANRLPLLQTWVKAKQMLQAPIGKGLGTQDEADDQGQNPLTRAMIAVEMLQLNRNGIAEFRDTPSLAQTVEMVGDAAWTDKLIEIQMWSRLAYLAHATNDHKLVSHCAQKALAFAESGTQPKGKKQDHHKYVVEQELLSFASSLYGQSLVANTQGKNSIRRKAMEQFLYSAQFACKAQNGELVMLAARRYWNACLPIIKQPIERELVKEPLTALLQCISDTTDKSAYKKATEEEEEEEEEDDVKEVPPKPTDVVSGSTSQIVQKSESATEVKPSSKNSIGDPEDDLTLRACLYGVLFQSYADKGEWEAGLQAMDKALADMPRTSHRLLIFKHLVIVKAKLGQNVSMSIQKFKDESEDYVANMWRSVALCSAKQAEQLQGYQNAIGALTLPSNDWQKVDLLVEFGQWLYCNELPLDDIIGVLEWAADILLNMSFEEAPKPEGKMKKSKSQKKLKTPPESVRGLGKTGKRKSVTDSKKTKDNAGKKTPVPNEPPPTNQSGDAEVGEPGDLVPTEKEVIIGCPPKNPELAVNDLRSVQQLEGLFRISVLNAQVAGRSSAYFADYCLMAHTYVVRMWQVSLGSAGPVIKELAKNASPEPANKGAPGKGKDKKESVKEKPKRKGPLDAMPRNTEEWAAYDAPDEVLEAFKQDSMKICGINSSTITKPSLTVFYLETLCTQLQELGYHHLALPVLALGDAVARLILESKPAAALIHLKAMEVCVQLNLIHAAHFHETLSNIELNKEDQAKSQEEIRQWKEKQIQVRNEELRIRESLARLRNTESKTSQADKEFQQKLSANDQFVNHLGRELGAVKFRDVWTESAEVLLRNAMYQPARDMLNEAYQAATGFEDHILAARILYLLGKLSFSEAQYGQAISFCLQAQKLYDGDEMFWYETVVLIVDATLADYQVKQQTQRRKAEGVLSNSLSVFEEIADSRPNKQTICQFVLSKLEAKLGGVEADRALCDNLSEPGVIATVLKACQRLQKAGEDLVSLGYRREALGIFKERAKLYATLARESGLTRDKHAHYVTTLEVLESARQVAAAVWQDVQSLSSIQEMKQVSCPAQRELAELNLLCAEMMLEMFEIHVHEMRDKQVEDQRKGSVLRAVEELVRETPDYSSSEQHWIDYTDHLAEKALATLDAAHSLGAATPQLKARALFNSGRCLHLLADLKRPDSPGEWDVQSLETLSITQGFEKEPLPVTSSQQALDADPDAEKEADDTTSVKDEIDTTSPEYIKYTQALGKLQKDSDISTAYMVQATECLTQAVNLALSKGLKEIAASAALELVECLGQFDPSLASQYLALHQSCQASLHMQAVLTQALLDPTVSRQAALLHQLQSLRADSISSNLDNGPIMNSIANTLQNSSKAWSRLEVMPQHLDLLKEFPPNFNLVILQHSPDKSHLYGAVLDKPKPGGGGKSKGHATLQGSSAAKVVRIATSAEQLQQLLDRCRGYKAEKMQMLLKMEYQYSLFAQREKMLANLESEGKPKQSDAREVIEEDFAETSKRLDSEFEQLVSEIDSYLKPLTSQLDQILRPPSSTTVSNAKDGKKEENPNEYVVLLADQFLLELPLEALPALQAENVVSLTRDISMQMLYHKLHVEVSDEPEKDKGKAKNAIPPRIPGLREAGKKQSKIIPLDRPVPQHCVPVDTHGFRYIVDPFQDCSETEQCKPIEVLNAMMEEHSQQFTPRWLGVTGEDHIPSPAEFEIYATEGSAFVFYGMERLCCYLPPSKVASMNLTSCQLAMLYDLAQTSESSLRQSKTDVFKSANVLAQEKSVDTALLLSLAGVNCVFLNQWHCTLQDNAERLESSMRDLLANGKTTGECARLMFTPFRRESDEAEGDKEEKTGETETKPTEANLENDATKAEDSGDKVDENPPEMVTSQAWYNMVCYGAPNIMVTQLSK